jgi:hypothetical protein
MADFLLDPLTGDLDLGDSNNSTGLQLCPDYTTEVEQRVVQSFDINLGEWFADISVYIPYIKNTSEDSLSDIRYILGDKTSNTANYIKHVMDNHLDNLDFIKSYTSEYSFDQKTREFNYNYSVVADSGIEVTFPSYTLSI